jgi:hypothetical protein
VLVLAAVPVLGLALAAEGAWEMESAQAAPALEWASVWVAKAVGQVEARAPGLEEKAAVVVGGVLPPGSPAFERR